MRLFLLFFAGIFIGLWTAWPGMFLSNNWRCFRNIIEKSSNDKISFRAALAVSPNYLLKTKNSIPSKIRIVADACFR